MIIYIPLLRFNFEREAPVAMEKDLCNIASEVSSLIDDAIAERSSMGGRGRQGEDGDMGEVGDGLAGTIALEVSMFIWRDG